MANWIPCKERLPEKGVSVLVTTRGYYFGGGEIKITMRPEAESYAYEDNPDAILWYDPDFDMNSLESEFLDEDYVLAWMPLPEPYKEEVNG